MHCAAQQNTQAKTTQHKLIFFHSLTFLCFCHCPPDSSLRHFSVPSHLKCSHWALQNVRFALVCFKVVGFFLCMNKKTQPSLLIRQLFPLTRKNMLLLNWPKALLASSVFFFLLFL